MIVLGIESSCDETGAAVVDSEKGLLSQAIHTQIDMHRAYGGVVPELASRDHIRRSIALIDQVVRDAGITKKDISAVAVTEGPGLAGALLVGAGTAHAIGMALGVPVIGVHHLEGHLMAALLSPEKPEFPFLALLVSGGHTQFMKVTAFGEYELLGETLDDAAGEAFDKAARVLGLPYPGGPLLDKLSREGNPHALKLPHVQTPGRYDYSFSGLKTALINTVHKLRQNGQDVPAADIAASFQHAAVELLSDKAMLAAVETGAKTVALAGGVASNSGLRNTMNDKCQKAGVRLVMPPPILCTDNAAMIGSAAFYRLMRGETAGLDLNACPSLRLV